MDLDYEKLPRKSILCIDMKSFFASVEAVERGLDPLKTYLAVVGNLEQAGSIILAVSPALKKKYHIKTGNRLFEIPKVPEIKVVEARMRFYLNKSMEIIRFFNRFVPLEAIHVYSIDEAWLKLDGTEKLLGDRRQVAITIQQQLLEEFGLPCSIGIGPNMFLAKVAMDIEGKKRGIAEWTYEDVPQKLWPLQLDDCWGIGKRLARRLNKMGIRTVGGLARVPLKLLENKFGIMGNQLYYHAWGVDLSEPGGHYYHRPKSLGKGVTLLRDYEDVEEIKTVILELCEEVGRRARRERLAGKTIALGIGYGRNEPESGFYVQRTIKNFTNLTMDIYRVCLDLFKENYRGLIVRRVYVTLTSLVPESAVQLDLFNEKMKEIKLARVMDEIRDKFGPTALLRAESFNRGGVLIDRRDIMGGHKA